MVSSILSSVSCSVCILFDRYLSCLMAVMLRRANFYSICFAFGLSVLLILAGSRYTDNINFRPSPSSESRGTIRKYLLSDREENLLQPAPTTILDEWTPDREMILKKTRAKIKMVLEDYNVTSLGVNKLEDLIMDTGGSPVRTIIISTWRSGTTFLGEVLNAIPGNFYHYEPLLRSGIVQIRGPPQADPALDTIRKMLKCDYRDMEEYFDYGKSHLHVFSHNTRLYDSCKYTRDKELCFDADYTSRFCGLFPFQSMKIVRMRLALMMNLVEDTKLHPKIILLIRDPRGVMQSRYHRDFCRESPDCWLPEMLCADMISDYVAAGHMLTKFPDKLKIIRFEELAMQPNKTTYELFKFLGFSLTHSVMEFLHLHTNVYNAGVSSTFRVSKNVPFRWKELNFSYVEEIQGSCSEAMALWGYKMAYNASHLKSKNFNPLGPYTVVT